MSKRFFPSVSQEQLLNIGGETLGGYLQRTGKFPPLKILIKPLEQAQGIGGQLFTDGIELSKFSSYQFSSSMLVPVDSFSFTFSSIDGPPIYELLKEGDIAVLMANGVAISSGVIDSVETEVDNEKGESGTIEGRDLLSQLEDQDAISMDSSPIWTDQVSVQNGVKALLGDTRITRIETRDAPTANNYLVASEPGESKLAVLQRFLEPLNCIAWMLGDGTLAIGRPNMAQARKGQIILNRERRQANCFSMRSTRASARIANAMVAIWTGQETIVDRVGKEQIMLNAAAGPSRLFKLGHRIPKTVVWSSPKAPDAQGLSDLNRLAVGGANNLQAMAKRELARQNVQELIVQAYVPGHFNDLGEPYMPDTVYGIDFDRGSVAEDMYLYQVDYELTEDSGQRTALWFCRLGTIVSDVRAP